MNINTEVSVYDLVTQLCRRLIDKHKPVEHPYLPQKDDSGNLKKIRSRAFEILLKKSTSKFSDNDHQDVADPIVELLKYTFVLKSALRRFSRAEELENLLEQLNPEESPDDSVYCVLQFLSGLKSFESRDDDTLDVFHYGRPNPLLPEQPNNAKEVPRYQVYPLETFVVPERFEAMLGMESGLPVIENGADPRESLSFENQFKSATTIGIETLSTRSERTIGSMLSAPRYTVRLVSTREFSTSSYFMPRITDESEDREGDYSTGNMGFFPEPEPPWLCVKSAGKNCETRSETSDVQSSANVVYDDKSVKFEETRLEIWEDIGDIADLTDHRTWETLGCCEAPREPPFVTETNEAMLHLEKIKQAGFLLLLPLNVVGSLNMMTEVNTEEFMENIRLLLLGVESRTFVWNEKVGFRITRNTAVPGLSVEALKSACDEIAHWGGCYKSLSKMTKPDPQTGKMRQEGLIFRAMCNSVKELLLYYQAVILRITIDNKDSRGLLRLLKNVRPVGTLIAEVARLCRCDRDNRETLGEGLGILSHIYDEVTRITRPSVALVFYSILKSCCEVYFRLLQKWLFEGTCDDEYGEFMIKIRPQYARDKGHSFWTKAFAINKNSVPGFIGNLAESILQCGKTVRLLKICDPKNSLTTELENFHPSVRVCLSVGMVREQEFICRDFLMKGEESLGPNVSFLVAFEEQRRAERKRAELVINAQRDTLLRIKREREEAKIEEARGKREFLAQLKDQAEEVASRKEREREAELLKDKRYLEEINAADEIAKNALIADKKNTLDYYNELAAEVERRRTRTDWRTRRIKLFHERADLINRTRREIEDARIIEHHEGEEIVDNVDDNLVNTGSVEEKSNVPIVPEDVNKNSTKIPDPIEFKSFDPVALGVPEKVTKICNESRESTVEIVAKKSPRPCVLDIKKTTTTTIAPLNLNENRTDKEVFKIITERPRDLRLDESEVTTDSRRNKLEVLQRDYGMTPNNNEFNIIVVDAEGNENTIRIDPSTIDNVNMRKNCELEMHRNRDRNTRHRTDSWRFEVTGEENNENLTNGEKFFNVNAKSRTEEFSRIPQKNEEKTEARKNRDRNMTHTYRDSCTDETEGRVNFANATTELQKNRARVMGHDDRNYRDYVNEEAKLDQLNCLDPLTLIGQITDCPNGVTPMSCTTDTFLTSTSDSSTQLHNCVDCFSVKMKNGSLTNAETPSDSGFANDPSSTVAPDKNFGPRNDSYWKFFSTETATAETAATAATPIFESSLTVEDVEMIDNTSLQVYLEKSVATPLRVQSRLANAAVVKYLIYDCNMLSHLHSLRSFFFLLNGEFAKSLTNSLYNRLYEISVPMELFKTSTLTNFLEQAINSSLSSSYENSERLSLSAIDVPSQLQVSNPEFLNCLSFNYKISWPLNIIIDDKILQQYSKVFKFLLMVGRVLYVLQEDFHILKVERKATISSQYHKLQLYRHSMMQFITALHNYLTCSVLHESWTEFEKELANATTIDEIYLTHVSYIRKILSRCMLTSRGEKMRTFLSNIFKVILKFHNRVRSQNWSSSSRVYTQANFDRLESMYKTFCDARTYLAHVADKLASSGYQPHLTHFLNALNINPLYDLTDMGSSKRS